MMPRQWLSKNVWNRRQQEDVEGVEGGSEDEEEIDYDGVDEVLDEDDEEPVSVEPNIEESHDGDGSQLNLHSNEASQEESD